MGIIAQEGADEVSESRMLPVVGISVWKLPPQFHDFSLQMYRCVCIRNKMWVTAFGVISAALAVVEQLWPAIVHWSAIYDHSCKFTISYSK